jgi:hypothetical protein
MGYHDTNTAFRDIAVNFVVRKVGYLARGIVGTDAISIDQYQMLKFLFVVLPVCPKLVKVQMTPVKKLLMRFAAHWHFVH